MLTRIHVLIDGRVQGVGFRYATRAQAHALGLRGWVRNRPDRRVEALFEGEESDVEAMVAWCHHGPAFAAVSQVEIARLSGAAECRDFSLRS
jgi:acylphosphatase